MHVTTPPAQLITPKQARQIAGHAYIAVPAKVQKYAALMATQQQALLPLLVLKATDGLNPAQEKRVQTIYGAIDRHIASMANYLCFKAA